MAAVSTRPASQQVEGLPSPGTLSPQSLLRAVSAVSPGLLSGCLTMVSSCPTTHHQPDHYQAIKPRPARSCTHTRCHKMARPSTHRCQRSTSRARRSNSPLLALNRPRRCTRRRLPQSTSNSLSRTSSLPTWQSRRLTTSTLRPTSTHSSRSTGTQIRSTRPALLSRVSQKCKLSSRTQCTTLSTRRSKTCTTNRPCTCTCPRLRGTCLLSSNSRLHPNNHPTTQPSPSTNKHHRNSSSKTTPPLLHQVWSPTKATAWSSTSLHPKPSSSLSLRKNTTNLRRVLSRRMLCRACHRRRRRRMRRIIILPWIWGRRCTILSSSSNNFFFSAIFVFLAPNLSFLSTALKFLFVTLVGSSLYSFVFFLFL